MKEVFCIVEGHGDVSAFPAIMRRILHEKLSVYDVTIYEPYRLPRSQIARFGEQLVRPLRFGMGRLVEADRKLILVAFDADDDCPKELLYCFNEFISRENLPDFVNFVACKREYEAWFIAAPEGMRGREVVRDNAIGAEEPECVRDAKGFLEKNILKEGVKYSETVDQERISHWMDMEAVSGRCRSFRRLEKILTEFVESHS